MMIKKQQPLARGAGVLLPVSCLPSDFGIGTFGKEAYKFVDFLKSAGQKYWQVLPLGPTSYGDSPYSSFSAFAGNPYYIDLALLAEEGLLKLRQVKKTNWGNPKTVDYAVLYSERFKVLRSAYKKSPHKSEKEYQDFCRDNSYWLEDYSLYMAVKNHFNDKEWLAWPEEIRIREPEAVKKMAEQFSEDIDFWKFCQYKFYEQWFKLKKYANENGVDIIGDIPIYVAMDSADAWVHNRLFDMDERRRPMHVAGVPPDGFCETGQLWGNPIYNWEQMEKEDFKWWGARIESSAKLFDAIRIDHFIGLVNYYSIPAEADTAKNGVWLKGPGEKLVSTINDSLGDKKIIAEDLGYVTPEVSALLKNSGYPGMKLLIMGFDGDSGNKNLPFHYEKNCVVYGGTHDNETLAGYFSHQSKEVKKFAREFLNVRENKQIPWAIIYAAYQSTANTVIFQLQDFLGLDNSARINIPSTIGCNWKWRLKKGQLTERLAKKIKKMTTIYGR